jgi:hypothetical protein
MMEIPVIPFSKMEINSIYTWAFTVICLETLNITKILEFSDYITGRFFLTLICCKENKY